MISRALDVSLSVHHLTTVSGSSVDTIAVVSPFVLGILAFALVYGGFYRHYRNTDKRYTFERDTRVEVANVQAFDSPSRIRTGVQSTVIDSRNSSRPLERVRRVQV